MKKITWLGHAAFKIELEGQTILIDPWIKGNPKSPLKSYKEINDADLVLVTHDHDDHGFKDAVKICKRTGATFIGVFELTIKARRKFVKKTIGGNIGGEININGTKVYLTPAFHSSKSAVPCGFIIKTNNLTIYHTGDTGYYSDMENLGSLYPVDVMLISICPNFMMGIKEASLAVKKVNPKIVIPCHYNTFPKLTLDPEEFKKLIGNSARTNILEIGKTFNL
jgi:L-ascorbate metabolism protein UlaG (beta-lactamase superfamily)